MADLALYVRVGVNPFYLEGKPSPRNTAKSDAKGHSIRNERKAQ